MYKLFGIPNCDTVKKARVFLENKKIDFEFIDFKKTPPSLSDVERWRKAFHDFPVNSKGATFKKLKDEYLALTDKDKIQFLTKNTSMIKRPILEKEGVVLSFGFSESDYQKVMSK